MISIAVFYIFLPNSSSLLSFALIMLFTAVFLFSNFRPFTPVYTESTILSNIDMLI
jgi:hypothetical protein